MFKRAQIANDANVDYFFFYCDAYNSNAYGATFVLGLHANDRIFKLLKKHNRIFLEDNYEQKYDGFDPNNLSQ